mgnify:CR=1 FL=1
MKLRHQLVTLSLGLSLLLILILGGLLALFIRHLLESNLEAKGSDLARVLAADARVVQALQQGSKGFGHGDPMTAQPSRRRSMGPAGSASVKTRVKNR